LDQEDQGDHKPPWWTRTGFYILLMDAGEVLAPFRLRKPQSSSASDGGDSDNDNDNAGEWGEVPAVGKRKRRVSDIPGMVRKLRADRGT